MNTLEIITITCKKNSQQFFRIEKTTIVRQKYVSKSSTKYQQRTQPNTEAKFKFIYKILKNIDLKLLIKIKWGNNKNKLRNK